jgi:hypothetical protein
MLNISVQWNKAWKSDVPGRYARRMSVFCRRHYARRILQYFVSPGEKRSMY